MSNADIAKKFNQYFEEGDINKLKSILADDFKFSHKSAPQPLSRQEFLDTAKALHAAMPDWSYNASNIKEGTPTTMTVQITASHKGTLDLSHIKMPVVPATQKRIKLPAENCSLEIRGGKIHRLEVPAVPGGGIPGIYAQLGVKIPSQEETRRTHV